MCNALPFLASELTSWAQKYSQTRIAMKIEGHAAELSALALRRALAFPQLVRLEPERDFKAKVDFDCLPFAMRWGRLKGMLVVLPRPDEDRRGKRRSGDFVPD